MESSTMEYKPFSQCTVDTSCAFDRVENSNNRMQRNEGMNLGDCMTCMERSNNANVSFFWRSSRASASLQFAT